MPLYEYECDACAHRFERIQKFSDPLVDTCPKCGGHVRKLLSSPAIQFKGAGFYINDYPKKGSDAAKGNAAKNDAKSDGGKAADTSGGSSDSSASSASTATKADTKSESKSDSKSDSK
jgi:putative FmdB family regulatory protein